MVAIYRIFLSSPGDVDVERDVVREVVDRLNQKQAAAPHFELFRWEEGFYTADQTFQDQVISPADCDLVICIFWKRLGTELPLKYQRPDGTVPTGTEYEFEVALQAATSTDPKIPDVLVYRKTAPVQFSEETLEFEKAQRDRFLVFWRRWFHSEKGHFVAAFHSFADPGEFEQILKKHLASWLARRSGRVVWTQGPPYRGLRPYDFEHAPIFFGRAREVERTRARLISCAMSGRPFLMILGPSGSGKSSLARAGVLPRLAAPGGLSEIADRACHATFTPDEIHDEKAAGGWALGLARCLFRDEALGPELGESDFDRPEALAALFEHGEGLAEAPLIKALRRAEARLGPDRGGGPVRSVALVITVDQFEEVFRWPEGEADAFVGSLASLLAGTHGTKRILALATMRSDYQHRISDLPALDRLVGRRELRGPEDAERTIEISPPGHADLRDILVGPARAAGLEFEIDPATAESLQHRIEAEARPDALPALQYLLSELYRLRDGTLLTLRAHSDLGGVAGVMATRGEAVLSEAGADVAKALPRVLRTLVTYGAGDGQPTSRAVRADAFPAGSAEAALVDKLVQASLITSDRGMLRIAHESLLTGWRRLSSQIEEEKRFLEMRERLAQLHRRYTAIEGREWKRRKFLLVGFPLAEGRELLAAWGKESVADLDPALPKFIERSIAADRYRRGGRLAMVVTATCVILFAGTEANRYREDALRAANEAQVRLELAKSEASLRQRDWDSAVTAGLRAYEKRDAAETRSAVLSALIAVSPYLERTYLTRASAIGWTLDRSLLLGSTGQNLRVDPIKGGAVRFPAVTAEDAPTVGIASDGQDRLVLLEANGRLAMFAGAKTENPASKLPGSGLHLARAHQHDWYVSMPRVVVAMADGFETVWLRDCVLEAGIECKDATIAVEQASAVALSPNGSQVAVATQGVGHDHLAIYELGIPDGPPTALLKIPGNPDDEVLSLAWSPSGPHLAVGRRGGSLVVIGLEDGDTREVTSTGVPVLVARWSADGRRLAYSCSGNAICVLGFGANGEAVPQMRFSGHRDTVTDFAFSPVEGQLASRSDDGTIRIWGARESDLALSTLHSDRQVDFRFVNVDPATHRITAGDARGLLWIWEPGSTKPVKLAPPDPDAGAIVNSSSAADGAQAAAYENGVLAIWSDPLASDVPVVPPDAEARRLAWLGNGAELAATTGRGEVILVARDGALRRLPRFREGAWADGVVAIGDADLCVSHTRGALARWKNRDASWATIASESVVDDRLSALSLSVHPSGRWLVATRGDDRLNIYSLSGDSQPVSLNLLRPDTKTVTFSPDGSFLAALGSEGQIYIWDFDNGTGKATLKVTASDLPLPPGHGTALDAVRPVSWIAWVDRRRLAIATPFGEILPLSVGEAGWISRAEALIPKAP